MGRFDPPTKSSQLNFSVGANFSSMSKPPQCDSMIPCDSNANRIKSSTFFLQHFAQRNSRAKVGFNANMIIIILVVTLRCKDQGGGEVTQDNGGTSILAQMPIRLSAAEPLVGATETCVGPRCNTCKRVTDKPVGQGLAQMPCTPKTGFVAH